MQGWRCKRCGSDLQRVKATYKGIWDRTEVWKGDEIVFVCNAKGERCSECVDAKVTCLQCGKLDEEEVYRLESSQGD